MSGRGHLLGRRSARGSGRVQEDQRRPVEEVAGDRREESRTARCQAVGRCCREEEASRNLKENARSRAPYIFPVFRYFASCCGGAYPGSISPLARKMAGVP